MSGIVGRAVKLALPHSANDVAKLQAEIERDAPVYAAITVRDADEYVFATEIMSDLSAKRKDVLAMQRTGTLPLYGVARTIEGWFRPVLSGLDTAIDGLKEKIAAYNLARLERESEARQIAAQAATERDSATLCEALTVANEIAAAPKGEATTRYRWAIKEIDPEKLPREYFCPDVTRIQLEASQYPGTGPAPKIKGVTFERVADVRVKGKR